MNNQVKVVLSVLVTAFGAIAIIFVGQIVSNSTPDGSPVVPHFVYAQQNEEPKSSTSNQISPDGKENVVLTSRVVENDVIYNFITEAGTSYSMTLPKGVEVSLPFNAWSPDNKYFFFKQDNDFIVVTSDNEAVTILDKFNQKYPDLIMTEATGWASPQLVLVNANNPDGSFAHSFWFNPATGGFTQLSTQFR